jgi:hypothetical protein
MPITLDGTLGITTPALTVTGASTYTGDISTAGNLVFTTTGDRIIGDMSNGTLSNRLAFQTSTTNATTSLTVLPNGTSTTSQLNLEGDPASANGAAAQFINVGGSDVRIASSIRGSGTYLPFTIYTGGSERMRIDTSGNVGIGTSSPATKAEIYGTAAASNLALRITNTATDGYSTLQMGDANAGIYRNGSAQSGYAGASSLNLITVGAHNIGFSTGNTLRAVIDSAGNVGIGTASPVEKLTVTGAISLNTDLVLKEGTTARGYIFGTSAGLTYRATSGLPHIFQNVGTELMRITSAGNVGINTSSPEEYLEIDRGAATNNGLVRFDASTTFQGCVGIVGSSNAVFTGTVANDMTLRGANNTWIGSSGASPVKFLTSGVERMQITSIGNYKISPAYSGTISSGSYATLVSNVSGNLGTAIKIYGHLSENGINNASFGEWLAVSNGSSWTLNQISQAVIGNSYGTLNVQFSGDNLQIKSAANVALGQYSIVIEIYR